MTTNDNSIYFSEKLNWFLFYKKFYIANANKKTSLETKLVIGGAFIVKHLYSLILSLFEVKNASIWNWQSQILAKWIR